MNVPGMLKKMAVVAVLGVTGSAVGAVEPASFIDRVKQSQGITPGSAGTEQVTAPAAALQSSAGEPASFTARVQKSQGIEARDTMASAAVAATLDGSGEPTSFIARVAKSQGVGSFAVLEVEDQLSPEQIRLVQRALTASGHSTPLSGRLDQGTRSALMSFQRTHSLPVTGVLDARTVDALGFSPAQVAPVRGPGDDHR